MCIWLCNLIRNIEIIELLIMFVFVCRVLIFEKIKYGCMFIEDGIFFILGINILWFIGNVW